MAYQAIANGGLLMRPYLVASIEENGHVTRYQFSSFGDEWYEVARMTPVKMAFVVESYGGGTRGCAQSGPAD